MKYDCTKDIMEHKSKVSNLLHAWGNLLKSRAESHDNSKLSDPTEKALFDHWTPALREMTFGSDQYKQALEGMGEGVKLHYKANRHHPEHYPNGVNDMTLLDIIEMVADWMAAAWAKNTYVDLDHAAKRFGLEPQLVRIIANQLHEEDVWNRVNGAYNAVPEFCPPDMRDGHVEGFEKPNL